jgi:hypothetical protein
MHSFLSILPPRAKILCHERQSLHNALLVLHETALNFAGRQRVFIHTDGDANLIAVDPRLRVPPTFDAFTHTMQLLATDHLVAGFVGERLMRFVKSDIGLSLPPGIRRYAVCIADNALVADPVTFVASGPILVYVNVDPTKQCADEAWKGGFVSPMIGSSVRLLPPASFEPWRSQRRFGKQYCM